MTTARFRALLAGDACLRPASVANPLSMRAAAEIGYETAMLAGSVAALEILGAPDLALITLTELAEQVHRVARAAPLPLLVDGDHGYGNALSVRRTAIELAAAGAAAVTIEDTDLPASGAARLLPVATAAAKVRAGVEAGADIVIVGRTNAALVADQAELLARQSAFEQAGAEAIFFAGIKTRDALEAVAANARKPLILASMPAEMDAADCAALGVRICLQGHQPHFDAVGAHYRRLHVQRTGEEPAETDPRPLTKRLSGADEHARWAKDYLG
jgi:carboxyvinyl-carboxyphosphonate phosphorylmutase